MKAISGFLVKMGDGTRYLLPKERFIRERAEKTLTVYNEEIADLEDEGDPATPTQAREWAENYFRNPIHDCDIEHLFAGTHWEDYQDIAIRLPDDKKTPHDLWETAELSFIHDFPMIEQHQKP